MLILVIGRTSKPEEGPPGLLRRMVRQIAREQVLPETAVWNNIKRLADALNSDRPCDVFPLTTKSP
jgi:hypothetical protein